jgi:murein DD-endopeptidase MepM/ murein hydrolase activator NlpD
MRMSNAASLPPPVQRDPTVELQALLLRPLLEGSGLTRALGGSSPVVSGLFVEALADALAQQDVLHQKAATAPTSVTAEDAVHGGRVSSAFGMRADPFTGEQAFHHGVDVAAPLGTPVHAVLPGLVQSVRTDEGDGLGTHVTVQHANGLTTVYGHLGSSRVTPGQMLQRGQTLGTLGDSGRSTGPHLHLEVRQGGESRDPFARRP